jgi:muconate cycloisomerase
MSTIAAIELHVVRVPLVGRFETTHGAPTVQESALAIVRTDDGRTGLGCVDPQVPYTDEDAFDVVDTVRRYLGPRLIGHGAGAVRLVRERMDAAVAGRWAAKALLDMALWDLLAQEAGLPLHRLLGGATRDAVALCGWVGFGGVRETAEVAERWVQQGFRAVKVKIGMGLALDVERVAAVRAAVGEAIEVRVDANEGYRAQAALRIVDRLERFDIAHCEQPVPRWDLEGLAYVAARSPVPVMADECVATPRDALRILAKGAAQRMKVKLMKQGGVLPTLEILGMAAAAGVPCTMGHGFGLAISTLAEAHVAAVGPALLACSEMVGFAKMGDDVTAEPLDIVDGAVRLPAAPGLGVRLDPERLRRLSVATVRVDTPAAGSAH